jgi:hypothetical protein
LVEAVAVVAAFSFCFLLIATAGSKTDLVIGPSGDTTGWQAGSRSALFLFGLAPFSFPEKVLFNF